MCEVYCPVDALYVAPETDQPVEINEDAIAASGLLGSYRDVVGWGKGRTPGASKDKSYYTHRHLEEMNARQS